ncbi:MAG: glycosyltransferase family 4 protein [Phycisphaerales bacterium]
MTWCLVSREFPPKSGGGIGTYAASMVRGLIASGERVVVVTSHAAARQDDDLGGATVIRLPLESDERWAGPHASIASAEMHRLWRELGPHSVFSRQIASLMPELLDRFGVGVVEGCDTGAPLWHLLEARAASSWADRVRVITHVHSPSAWIERLNRRLEPGRWMHSLQRRECEQTRWSDGVITPSAGMARWAAAHWGVEADVIRYPLAGAPVSVEPEPTARGDAVFVGRLEYRKGIDTLLRAWPRVETERRLHLVGRDVLDYRTDEPIGAGLLERMPSAARSRVVAHGSLEPQRVAAMQRAAGVVVVPSPDDNFPWTCIEAMAAGRIVVAAAAGGAAEMIEDGRSGLLVPPGDEGALADAMTLALGMDEGERVEMGGRAERRIAELCDASAVIDARLAHARSLPAVTARPLSPNAFSWGGAVGSVESFTGGEELAAGWALRSLRRARSNERGLVRRLARRLRRAVTRPGDGGSA